MAQYLKFGNLTLTARDGVSGFEEQSGYNFATQSIATGKPVLQGMGETLAELTLNIILRQQLGHDIPAIVNQLHAIRRAGKPERLLFASGAYQGDYVITGISSTITCATATGEVIAIDLAINLMEFADRVVISQRYVERKPAGARSNRKVKEK